MTNKITIEEAAHQLRAALNRREKLSKVLSHASKLAATNFSKIDEHYDAYLNDINKILQEVNDDVAVSNKDLSNYCNDSSLPTLRDEFRSLQDLEALTERVGELEMSKASTVSLTSIRGISSLQNIVPLTPVPTKC